MLETILFYSPFSKLLVQCKVAEKLEPIILFYSTLFCSVLFYSILYPFSKPCVQWKFAEVMEPILF